MKKIFLVGIAAFLFLSCKKEKTDSAKPSLVENNINGTFIINSASTIEWEGSKQTGKHHGTLELNYGEFTVKKGIITEGRFAINMHSIDVKDLEGKDKIKLENHLKGINSPEITDHFFNVTKYPEATFLVTGFFKEDGSDMLEGDLTIKNKTNKIKFPISISEVEGKVFISSPSFEINRTLWGVTYGSKAFFDDLGDRFINDEVYLKLNLQASL
ncbi:YceI family protein [uncultured Flavobacterium sp.]|uniref:YceI family protein n=1 Tax=uncultured Flavobacterium sp. TaxID=165435 RepID=UPI0030CA3911